MAAQTRRLKDGAPAVALEGMERAIASIGAALEAELARARATAARSHEVSRASDVERIVENLVSVVERTERGERITFTIEIPAGLRVPVAAEDLTELLGALLENAARFAHRRVRLSGAAEPEASILRIEDDGPGIGRERSEAALVRGGRLDEAGPGHGLGLAIVNDLVSATGGTLALNEAPLGGLEVYLRWPASDGETPIEAN
jgi:signal transduction histidine kinase